MTEIMDIEEKTSAAEATESENAPKNYKAIIEAILFAAGYPLPYEKIAEVADISEEDALRYIAEIKQEYEDRESGLMIITYHDSCQICTKEKYAPEVRVALGIKQGGRLSNSALEVLAIVAYSQPVTRLQIEKIRGGIDCQYAVASLCAKNLIEPKGRLDMPGRPLVYGTTPDFMRCFGLSTLDELPEAKAFVSTAQMKFEELDGEGVSEGAEEEV